MKHYTWILFMRQSKPRPRVCTNGLTRKLEDDIKVLRDLQLNSDSAFLGSKKSRVGALH
jgi:hypothetical protein